MAKHETIYPTDEELEAIQKIVGNTEAALKKVSDIIAAEDSDKLKVDLSLELTISSKAPYWLSKIFN